MNILSRWCTRIYNLITEKDEKSQSIARIYWVAILTFYFWLTNHFTETFIISAGYISAAVVWYAWTYFNEGNRWRKYLSAILDQSLITAGLWILGPYHMGIFLLYFWVIIGNGYRFGAHMAWFAMSVALVGMISMFLLSPVWVAHGLPSSGIMHGIAHALELIVAFLLVTGFTHKVLKNLHEETLQRVINESAANTLKGRVMRDGLTGLCTREYAIEWLTKKKKRNSRVTVLFLDLDKFKLFNDNYGHHVGDQVLINISNRLSNCVRSEDIVCRYGGDEFIILLDDEDEETINEIGERINTSLKQAVEIDDGTRLSVTASIGVAIMGLHGDTPTEVMRHADAAMYIAKRKGRNRMAWFEQKVKG